MLVKVRVSKVIEDPVELAGIPAEPVDIVAIAVAVDPVIGNCALGDNDVDVVVLGQYRKQLGTVVGDTTALWWQRRNVGEPRAGLGRGRAVEARFSGDVARLHLFDGAARTFVPGELSGLDFAVLAQLLPETFVGQSAKHRRGDRLFRTGVE
ncbi:hypothetical protein D9M71_677090 [compost metagenome]